MCREPRDNPVDLYSLHGQGTGTTKCVEPEDALNIFILGSKHEIRTGIHVPKTLAQAITPIPFSFCVEGEIEGIPVTSPRYAHVHDGPWLGGLRSGPLGNDRWRNRAFFLPEVNVISRQLAWRQEEAELEVCDIGICVLSTWREMVYICHEESNWRNQVIFAVLVRPSTSRRPLIAKDCITTRRFLGLVELFECVAVSLFLPFSVASSPYI